MSEMELLAFTPAEDHSAATITIDLTTRSAHAVSPLLYGKFCEHLGHNIYLGMDAQVLYNHTFGKMKVQEGFFADRARRLGWPDPELVKDSYDDGAALGWFRLGAPDEVLLSPDVGPGGNQAQRFETPGASPDAVAGIAQWVYLPTHRTRRYELSMLVRATDPCELQIALLRVDADGEIVEEIALVAGDVGPEWKLLGGELDIDPDAALDGDGPYLFALTTEEPANVVVDYVAVYPADHLDGADPEIIALLKEAKLSVLRWPGGNFVSAYHWMNGVGPTEARPTAPNPVWGGTFESNWVGTDKFLAWCRHVGCEPMICVNAGNGTPEEAAGWVEYCNGGEDTDLGRLRALNGHPEPHNVKYWEIGNEIFGRHQVGWTTPAGNVDRFLRFSEAMKAVDPSIRILACGGLHLGVDAEWNRRLCTETNGAADCQTHHILEGGTLDPPFDVKELYHAFMAYPMRIREDYELMRRRMAAAGIADGRIAITELQLFAHVRRAHEEGRELLATMPTPSTISEALYLTLILHECIRLGDFVEMVTHSATVNHGGGLRKHLQRVWANPVHHAHVMGVEMAGAAPVKVHLTCGTFSTGREFGHLPAVEAAPDLDALAVVDDGEGALTLMIVHRSAQAGPVAVTVDLGGFVESGQAEVVTLKGESLSDENTFEQPEKIVPVDSTAAVEGGKVTLTVAPYSLTRVRVRK